MTFEELVVGAATVTAAGFAIVTICASAWFMFSFAMVDFKAYEAKTLKECPR